ncbi:MAG: Histidinol-phosphatase [Fimbriimonadaceae bacterium]|nr:Histidinol-phosphatase [Fimbriimonadaceae bacterium]
MIQCTEGGMDAPPIQPNSSFMSPRLAFALQAVSEAGKVIMDVFRSEASFNLKNDESPVTAADLAAERLMRERIEDAFPGEAILGEEEGESVSAANRWVIDPIDGTKSFVARVPLFATLLSYEVDGEPILGVCAFPALGEMVYAERGAGAFWNDRLCHVSTETARTRGILATGSMSSLAAAKRLDGIMQLSDKVMAIRNWTDAYGHALVATGRIQAMIDPVVAHWDISAIKIIVEEAGGRFTDFSGVSQFGTEAISSHGLWHDEIVAAFS